MTSRRDRGSALITAEERLRRVQEAKKNIRETATYTPALLALIQSRIEANTFRRCISNNTIYHSLCDSLKDKNIPERDRRPDLVDFLALEAIVPVNYDGQYNRVLQDLFVRCQTEAWAEKAVLQANHEWFQDAINKARKYVKTLIARTDPQLLEIVLGGIDTSFWRADIRDHSLYHGVIDKVAKGQTLTQRDVITAVAINGGKYPTEIFRHLVVNQNSNMLNWGGDISAQNALYDDEDFQVVHADTTIYSETMANLESFAKAMQNKHKGLEVSKKIREMKELMKDDVGVLRHTQGGRVQKVAGGSNARRAHTGDGNIRSRRNCEASSSLGLPATQEPGDYGRYFAEGQGAMGGEGDHGDASIKRQDSSSDEPLGQSS
ncbi:hypothetical protein LX32DRAFT_707245 [Colletotrichum zoysiae]|uniref:Uncharacterized protein n=1 Tax=Colletotrichum zoysiae TaxID=1216348 RepID=A0AAD9H746_9PEZI|nr:hypothetical protein LX32DRAFT_707245 [Colletotrichum zoysiae]